MKGRCSMHGLLITSSASFNNLFTLPLLPSSIAVSAPLGKPDTYMTEQQTTIIMKVCCIKLVIYLHTHKYCVIATRMAVPSRRFWVSRVLSVETKERNWHEEQNWNHHESCWRKTGYTCTRKYWSDCSPKDILTLWSTISDMPSKTIFIIGFAHWNAPHCLTLLYLYFWSNWPVPSDKINISPTLCTPGNSALLWRTWAMAAAVGLFITRPPSMPTIEVFPFTDIIWVGLKNDGTDDVARQISHKLKFHLSSVKAEALENSIGLAFWRS